MPIQLKEEGGGRILVSSRRRPSRKPYGNQLEVGAR